MTRPAWLYLAILGAVAATLSGCDLMFQQQMMHRWACEGARPDPRCSHPAPNAEGHRQ